MKVIHVETHKEKELILITSRIASAIKSYGWRHGVLVYTLPIPLHPLLSTNARILMFELII